MDDELEQKVVDLIRRRTSITWLPLRADDFEFVQQQQRLQDNKRVAQVMPLIERSGMLHDQHQKLQTLRHKLSEVMSQPKVQVVLIVDWEIVKKFPDEIKTEVDEMLKAINEERRAIARKLVYWECGGDLVELKLRE